MDNKYLDWYLKENNFDNHFKKLVRKLKNKKVVVYGAGLLFQYVSEKYDLSKLNIIGVSDMKFALDAENTQFMGYNVIPKQLILKYNPDYILMAVEKYQKLIERMAVEYYDYPNIKVIPLVRIKYIDILKSIWSIKW